MTGDVVVKSKAVTTEAEKDVPVSGDLAVNLLRTHDYAARGLIESPDICL